MLRAAGLSVKGRKFAKFIPGLMIGGVRMAWQPRPAEERGLLVGSSSLHLAWEPPEEGGSALLAFLLKTRMAGPFLWEPQLTSEALVTCGILPRGSSNATHNQRNWRH